MTAFILGRSRRDCLPKLTKERSKQALPIKGKFRTINFARSDLVDSDIYSIYVLTHYESQSLSRHLRDGGQFGNLLENQFIIPVAGINAYSRGNPP